MNHTRRLSRPCFIAWLCLSSVPPFAAACGNADKPEPPESTPAAAPAEKFPSADANPAPQVDTVVDPNLVPTDEFLPDEFDDLVAPTDPARLTANADTPDRVVLQWSSSEDEAGGSGLDAYRIFRNETLVVSVAAPATTYTDSQLTADTPYAYRVVAVDRAGNPSQPTPSVVCRTPVPPTPTDALPPSVPRSVTVRALSTSKVVVYWDQSSDEGGSNLAGYRVFRDSRLLATVSPLLSSQHDDTVRPQTTYVYQVSAFDGAGNDSGLSFAISVTTPAVAPGDKTPPDVPTALALTVKGTDRIDLTWGGSTDNAGGSGMRGYRVYRNGALITELSPTVTAHSDTGLLASTTYAYAVSAIDKSGNESALSTGAIATTLAPADTIPPAVPDDVNATLRKSVELVVDLTWQPSLDTGGTGMRGYRVYRAGELITEVSSAITEFSDKGLAAGQSYCYQISAIDMAGNESKKSAGVKVDVPPVAAGE